MRFKRTFTLIEILVVLSLLSLFAALLVPSGLNLLRQVQIRNEQDKISYWIHQVELLGLLNQSEWFLELKQEKKSLQVAIRLKDSPQVFAKDSFKNLRLNQLMTKTVYFHPVFLWGAEKRILLVDHKNNEVFLPLK